MTAISSTRRWLAAAPAPTSPQQWPLYDGDRIAAGILHGLEKGAIVAVFADPRMQACAGQGPRRTARGDGDRVGAAADPRIPLPVRQRHAGVPRRRLGRARRRALCPPGRTATRLCARRLVAAARKGRVRASGSRSPRRRMRRLPGPDQERKASRHRLRFDDQRSRPDLVGHAAGLPARARRGRHRCVPDRCGRDHPGDGTGRRHQGRDRADHRARLPGGTAAADGGARRRRRRTSRRSNSASTRATM